MKSIKSTSKEQPAIKPNFKLEKFNLNSTNTQQKSTNH